MINPDEWLQEIQNFHRTRKTGEWQNGKTHPEIVGWYERYFTDGTFFQWWDGEFWLIGPMKSKHWRQGGDYPAWRGLNRK